MLETNYKEKDLFGLNICSSWLFGLIAWASGWVAPPNSCTSWSKALFHQSGRSGKENTQGSLRPFESVSAMTRGPPRRPHFIKALLTPHSTTLGACLWHMNLWGHCTFKPKLSLLIRLPLWACSAVTVTLSLLPFGWSHASEVLCWRSFSTPGWGPPGSSEHQKALCSELSVPRLSARSSLSYFQSCLQINFSQSNFKEVKTPRKQNGRELD